jgi:nucleoside 2-deoxyribosyltransferase
MKSYKVYTAGPITGCSWGGCTNWREYVEKQLDDISDGRIVAYSPLRSKEYLSNEKEILDVYPDTLSVMSTQRGIFHRDRNDVKTSDLVFVNMIGAGRVSIGTVMEIAWADAWNIPIVYLTEKDVPNIHDHAMMREACPFTVHDMEEAILLTKKILLP